MIELLSPAGDMERLKIAIHYGANAVYLGGLKYGLRANAINFSNEELKKAVKYVHRFNKKIYVTLNIIFHDEDFEGLEEYLLFLDSIKIDAIMVSDIAVIELCNKLNLKLNRYLSTQTSILNSESALFYQELGIKRIVLAREALKNDITDIKKKTNLELEAFIHGAMCTSFSGKCIMSNYTTLRDANRGGCAQVCRWLFDYNDSDNNLVSNDFQMCPKDLNMVQNIEEMIKAGVNSFKIEGRMRSIYYIATILHTYRSILDHLQHKTLTSEYTNYCVKILNRCANRESVPQFFNELPATKEQYYLETSEEPSNQDFLGIVLSNENNIITIEQRNYLKIDDEIQFFGPNTKTFDYTIKKLYDEEMNEITVANHPLMIIKIKAKLNVKEYDMIRIKSFDIYNNM